LLLISISLTAGFRVVGQVTLPAWGSMFLTNVLFWHCLVFFLSAVLTFVVFLFLYRFVPNTPVRWRDIWGGALAAAVCFEGTKFFFLWFVGNFGRYNLIYGPIGALIALLMWTYVSAVIFLFCAKLTSVYARQRGDLPSGLA
ncbi:MAG: YihY/virulence factor BrkB family protein, partial [Dehalococcoidia bacterium]|nr:YihY/virulence factor BrkB family protein [Dehalococcoidia bacterium]